MGEFIVTLMFTLPGHFLLSGLMRDDAAEHNRPLLVIVSVMVWVVSCLIVYAIAYAIAMAFQ